MRFHLVGRINWAVGSNRDSRSKDISVWFDAENKEGAVEKARLIISEHHGEHLRYTDYGLCAHLFECKPVWGVVFHDEVPARQAVPAEPARPRVEAHFEEFKPT